MATSQTTTTKPKQRSYFMKDKLNRYYLDEESYIEHKPLDEGLFQAYQDLTSQVRISGDSTEVDMKLGAQRRFLFENLVKSWNLVDEEGEPVPYTAKRLHELPPDIMNGLYDDIYESNKILKGDDASDAEKKDTK